MCVYTCSHAITTVYVHVAYRLTVACVLYIHSCMKCASMHSYWGACLLHPSQGHLSMQFLGADLHQRSICIFPDDAAVLWVVVVLQPQPYYPISHFTVQSCEPHVR